MRWQNKYKQKPIGAEQAQLSTFNFDVLVLMMKQSKDIGVDLAKRYRELKNVTSTSHGVDDYPLELRDLPDHLIIIGT